MKWLRRMWLFLTRMAGRGHARNEFVEFVDCGNDYRVPEKLPRPVDDRQQQRQRRARSKRFIRAIDTVADSIEREWRGKSLAWFSEHFGELDISLCPKMVDFLSGEAEIDLKLPAPDVVDALNYSLVDISFMAGMDGSSAGDNTGWVAHRLCHVAPRKLRSRVPLHVPGAIWLQHDMTMDADFLHGRFVSYFYLTRDGGKTWAACWFAGPDMHGRYKPKIRPLPDDLKACEEWGFFSPRFIEAAASVSITRDVGWSLLFTRGRIRFVLRVRENVARELISMRDAHGTRRAASRHWVKQHHRKRAGKSPVLVKSHIRGETEFTWGDWMCEIRESEFDRAAAVTGLLPITDPEERLRWRMASVHEAPIDQ